MPDEALWKLIRRNSFIILQRLVHQALRQGFFCSTRGQNVRDKQDVTMFNISSGIFVIHQIGVSAAVQRLEGFV